MFFLEWKGKAVDDRTLDLQKLRNAVEPLRLIYELEENVVDRSPDVGP